MDAYRHYATQAIGGLTEPDEIDEGRQSLGGSNHLGEAKNGIFVPCFLFLLFPLWQSKEWLDRPMEKGGYLDLNMYFLAIVNCVLAQRTDNSILLTTLLNNSSARALPVDGQTADDCLGRCQCNQMFIMYAIKLIPFVCGYQVNHDYSPGPSSNLAQGRRAAPAR